MKKTMTLGLVVMTGAVLAMTGCSSMGGMKNDDMSSGMKGDMTSSMKGDMSSDMKDDMPSGQHPADCMCAACSMKNTQSM